MNMKGVRISRKELPSWLEAAPLEYKPFDAGEIEHVLLPESMIVKLKNKKKQLLEKKNLKIKVMDELIKRLPQPDEDFHIIGGGNIDAFYIIPCVLNYAPVITRMYIATWSMTQENIKELIGLYDSKRILELNIIISIFFQGRYKGDCAFLKTELKRRKQKIVICKNHAKVILMDVPGNSLIFQGSANFTANPRIEQMVLSNSHELFSFHQKWMDSLIGIVYNEKI